MDSMPEYSLHEPVPCALTRLPAAKASIAAASTDLPPGVLVVPDMRLGSLAHEGDVVIGWEKVTRNDPSVRASTLATPT
jgi:hypothetical protein